MSDANHRPTPDALDRATESLRTVSVPPGPPADVLAATVAAVHNRLADTVPAEVARLQRRRRIMRYVRYGSATTIAAGLLVAAGVLWVGGQSAEASFLKAMENAAKAKTVRAKVTRVDKDGPRTGHATLSVRGDRLRLDDETFVSISDTAAKTVLHLNPDKKQARTFTPADAADFQNPLDQLVRLKDAQPELVGEDTVGGRKVRVFRVKGAGGNLFRLRGEWTVWVDPTTELPVRMQLRNAAGVPDDKLRVTLDEFEWNVDLDAKLFDLTVPDGYTVTEVKAAKK